MTSHTKHLLKYARNFIILNCLLFYFCKTFSNGVSLVAQRVKHLSAMAETRVRSLGREDPLEKEMATHSSIIAWKIPWTEEPGGLHFMGPQRVKDDWVTNRFFHFNLAAIYITSKLWPFTFCHSSSPGSSYELLSLSFFFCFPQIPAWWTVWLLSLQQGPAPLTLQESVPYECLEHILQVCPATIGLSPH